MGGFWYTVVVLAIGLVAGIVLEARVLTGKWFVFKQ